MKSAYWLHEAHDHGAYVCIGLGCDDDPVAWTLIVWMN